MSFPTGPVNADAKFWFVSQPDAVTEYSCAAADNVSDYVNILCLDASGKFQEDATFDCTGEACKAADCEALGDKCTASIDLIELYSSSAEYVSSCAYDEGTSACIDIASSSETPGSESGTVSRVAMLGLLPLTMIAMIF